MYDREYFEEQTKILKIKCAVRRHLRELGKKSGQKRAERIARRIYKLGAHEADLMKTNERALILMRHRKGLSVNEIAKQLSTDLITVAGVIEGVV